MALIVLAPPPAGTPFAAYAPVIFRCADVIAGTTGYVPAEVIYCDVYVNNAYYKSLTATSGELLYFGSAPWYRAFEFDVQFILQEALRSVPPPIETFTLVEDKGALCRFKLAFRKGYKVNGITVFTDPFPKQGTMDTPSEAGGGVFTSNYQCLNAVLQHEEEEELSIHLATLRSPAANNPLVWPLTSRPDRLYRVGRTQIDFFPFYCGYNAFNALDAHGSIDNCNYRIDYKVVADPTLYTDVAASFFSEGVSGIVQLFGGTMYHMATGIGQLKQIAWANNPPSSDMWDRIIEYRVSIEKGESKIVVTPWITVSRSCNKAPRILFLNRFGGWDGINFDSADEVISIKSERWQKRAEPFRFYNSDTLQKRKGQYGAARLNVRSNETVTLQSHQYPYGANEWIKELFGAPLAYRFCMLTNTQKLTLFPIVPSDADFPVKKSEEQWDNRIVLGYQPANANNHQRI